MASGKGFFIPRRTYDILKCIYRERVTVITAPDGYGKSGIVREFVRRSRPDGFSCRFITDTGSANDCFRRICKLLLGHEEDIPTTAMQHEQLCGMFSAARPEKELLLILDCPAATDMLLGNLYCFRLFTQNSPIKVTLVTDELCFFHAMLIETHNIRCITENELALTENEIIELFRYRGATSCSAPDLFKKTGGQLAKIILSSLLIKNGEEIASYELIPLINQAVVDHLDRSGTFAALCAATLDSIDDVTLENLKSEPALCDYFGADSINRECIFKGLHYISSIIPMVRLNERTGSWKAHTSFRNAMYQHFMTLPEAVRHAVHRCSAKEYMRQKQTFRAFCQYYLSGDIRLAAMPERDEKLSFDLVMRSKDFLAEYVESCPLDCKPMIPRLLRILSLLMLTPHRDRVKHRFDDILDHVTNSPDYTPSERRSTLCYLHALRTYEDFYILEKMGNHIKRAYDLYTGTTIGLPPFYSWGLYVPSVFALIHNYDLPLATEAEQFTRYHNMYTEMIHHGEFIVSLYNAEMLYYTGNPEESMARALDIIDRCNRDLYLPTKIVALNNAAKCALMLGDYDIFTDCSSTMHDIVIKYSSTELSDMAALCLAQLCCLKQGSDEDIWGVSSKLDEDIMLNRYSAPFYFKVRCFTILSHERFDMLIAKADYYLSACDDVRSDTIALSIKLCSAIAHMILDDNETAMSIVQDVLRITEDSGIIAPAVELCMQYPELYESALDSLSERYHDIIRRIMTMAKSARRGMVFVRTKELTQQSTKKAETDILRDSINESMTALQQQYKELGLTPQAIKYALYAARRFPNEQIAEICNTSVNSVKSSLKRTYAKLGIRSRGQLKYIFNIRE